ncbi:group-specific protein [Sutcliffiella horikoshii]|uniref:Group-specific protein n=1 Tax=Sutcliffiella horikoshii TaxID=79883 RepID=A0A5D4SUJ2_9BACI|nr:group-specific protein [Sutcliffiella horikoshii]TYS67023.1 group-specific protein [Sutcliffiella horikoshii]
MINVQINEQEVRQLYFQKLEEKMMEIDAELIFWDSKELMRRTCLSWNNIQEKFFYDPRFPKHKVGQKWMFPAKQTRDFLLTWLSEQPTN